MVKQKIIYLSTNKKAQTISIFILGVIILFLLTQMYKKAYRIQGYDFTCYILAADTLLHSKNPYQTNSIPFHFIYPMFFAFALIPFLVFPYWIQNFLWFSINLISLFYAIYIIIKFSSEHLKTKWGKHLYVPMFVLFILMLGPIQNNLLNGQANLLVLLFSVLFLKYLLNNKNILSSFFLAVAISMKLVPLIFILFCLLRKKYLLIALTFIFTLIFSLLPSIFVGHKVLDMYSGYLNSLFVPSNFTGHYPMFFTMNGFISYLFPMSMDWLWLKFISLILVLIPIIILEYFNNKYKITNCDIWIFNLYLLAILLISPLSEMHHLAFLIPSVCLIYLKILFDENVPKYYGNLLVSFFICFILGNFFKQGPFYFFSIILLFWVIMKSYQYNWNNNKNTTS